jgi:hypothetical protein
MDLAQPAIGKEQEEERQELRAVLQSGILDKAPNLQKFLEYVAEQHFSGKTEQVKEYSIAVQALHRLEQFDPQTDTIVRVTAHTLRKKLEQYYATEGADHQIQIRLPAGKYILQFERTGQAVNAPADLASAATEEKEPEKAGRMSRTWRMIAAGAAVAAAAGLVWLGSNIFVHRRIAAPAASVPATEAGAAHAQLSTAAQDPTIRFRFGETSHPYVDVAGLRWDADQYCKGGSNFSHPNHDIQGTDDPKLFQDGREGRFQCRIPVPPGNYELLLLFADTAGDKEAARQVDFTINNAVSAALDIVDEAGGDDLLVGKVYTGVRPMADGLIHLDFTSDGSFVNAAEITPSDSDSGVAIRMVAGPSVFRDSKGISWLPERFFQGGRRTFHPDNLPKTEDPRLFEWERYGHFHYLLPVVAGKEYKVRLYFSEGWFGSGNGGPGGIGSRVFDVYSNGTTLLKDFDILQYQQSGTAVITFDHVKPTAHGMLDLTFSPVTNYPLINAIEVEPEK